MLEFLIGLQNSIRTGLSADINTFAQTRAWLALLPVLPLGIVFGAAHAGHCKAVLAAYVAGSDLPRLKVVLTAMALAVTKIGATVFLALVTTTLVTRTIVGRGVRQHWKISATGC